MKLRNLIIILIIALIPTQFVHAQATKTELDIIKELEAINIKHQKDKEAFTNAVKLKLKDLEAKHPHFTSLFISNVIKSKHANNNPALIKHLNDYCNRPKSNCTDKEKAFYASLKID